MSYGTGGRERRIGVYVGVGAGLGAGVGTVFGAALVPLLGAPAVAAIALVGAVVCGLAGYLVGRVGGG
ncbi:Hypothetical Protein RradSPS_2257 [Rubrobacter radiotolerans]|uniref:Uncharacterized protein n=1 Tax=Rubrobacter radiotolerans TaxID=42256 RepID=A0A023X6B9_RUBRA|nr:hypothetical protein [Rubrobacter radiotolerans]AHY47540.1 Hypothetical Protein RradSPS_2257 [Rubrobacter radiotolerans]MDX5894943.1 hypothetical protein [Rubrobacter radiotolerans]SMC07125.1 hypothetical protein SAMN00767673_2259 [Rubrobacter radiotolerans DSM 5868]